MSIIRHNSLVDFYFRISTGHECWVFTKNDQLGDATAYALNKNRIDILREGGRMNYRVKQMNFASS